MERAVVESHIALYVNEFTLDYGSEGTAAIEELMRRAGGAGVAAAGDGPLFA